ESLGRCRCHFAMRDLHRADVGVPPGDLVRAGVLEEIEDAELASLRSTPGRSTFAAHAVLELRFTLEHEDTRTPLCHRVRKRGAGEASTNRDDVVVAHV